MKLPLALVAVLAVACKSRKEPEARPTPGSGSSAVAPAKKTYDRLPRPEFNRWAVRTNLPVYWIADKDHDRTIDPDEVAALLFYPTNQVWVDHGELTDKFDAAYETIVAASKAPPDAATDEGKRQKLVGEDLDQGRATLVHTDFTKLSEADRAFVNHMLTVGDLVDRLYDKHTGAAALAPRLPADAASHSMFRRNRGPKCIAPATEKEKLCSAIPGAPKPLIDLYPAELQGDDKFCEKLAARKDAKDVLEAHFAAVRGTGDALQAVPYTEAYAEEMTAIAKQITAAADAMKDPAEAALVAYLRAAAASFTSNEWVSADEAWAKMTVDNSKWYVRVAPDEVYWEPCAQKAGVHLTFARINQDSRAWQAKLVPVQQEMEDMIAKAAGAPYVARKVTFHLPDFIDIVINAGDDRDPLGATIGQSLPNWGKVADESRGRTVAMTNLYTDPDSMAARREQAASLLDEGSMRPYAGTPEASLVNTILHEATHNLGPTSVYKLGGKSMGAVFGGPLASAMEELKAQTGGVALIELLRGKQIISDQQATQTYVDALVWALGHISQGMYTGSGDRKTYSTLAAIQIGILLEKGAMTWDPKALAANGKDTGAMTIHLAKLPAAFDDMLKLVAGIKARGDKAAAEQLLKKYVDSSTVVPHEVIRERFLRFPKASFVYSIAM